MKAVAEKIRKYYKYSETISVPSFSSASEAETGVNEVSLSNTALYNIFGRTDYGNHYLFYGSTVSTIIDLGGLSLLQGFSYKSWGQTNVAYETSLLSIEASQDNKNWTTVYTGDATSKMNLSEDYADQNTPYRYLKPTFRHYPAEESQVPAGISYFNTTFKRAIESTQQDYDFYKDVDVYKAIKETVRKYYKYESWTQPVLSSNGTIGVDDFAVSCSLPALTGDPYPRSLYLAFDGIIGSVENRFQSVSNTTNPQYIIVYSKNSLNIKSITFYQNTKETYYYIKAITIQGSNNGSDWTDLQTWTSNSYVANFTVDLSSNLEYYNCYRFYITNRAYYDSSNAYLMIQEISMTGTQAVESTESDYDFYKDVDVYKAIKSYTKGQYYGN